MTKLIYSTAGDQTTRGGVWRPHTLLAMPASDPLLNLSSDDLSGINLQLIQRQANGAARAPRLQRARLNVRGLISRQYLTTIQW